MVEPLPPDFPSDLRLIPGLPNPEFKHRAAYRITRAGNVVIVLEIATSGEQERGRFAERVSEKPLGFGSPETSTEYERLTRPKLYLPGRERPSSEALNPTVGTLPEPEYDIRLARERYGPFGPPLALPEPQELAPRPKAVRYQRPEWRTIGVVPYGAVSAFNAWVKQATSPARKYVGAAYAIWNGYLTVRPGGELQSGSIIPSSALIPYRVLRGGGFYSTGFRVENRPGASPVSVPTVLALFYASGHQPQGATTRIPNVLERYGWSICGHLRTSTVATYCPPVGAPVTKTEIELPPPAPGSYFIPRPGVRRQVLDHRGKAGPDSGGGPATPAPDHGPTAQAE